MDLFSVLPASPTAQRINLHYTHSQLPKHFPVDRVERMHQRLPNICWHTITLSLPIFGYKSAPQFVHRSPNRRTVQNQKQLLFEIYISRIPVLQIIIIWQLSHTDYAPMDMSSHRSHPGSSINRETDLVTNIRPHMVRCIACFDWTLLKTILVQL